MIYSRKILFNAFKQYLQQIFKDAMLILLCIAPILVGLLFVYGIPLIERLLTKYFSLSEVLQPYYLLFDLFMAVMTPLLYCFASAYVILGEIDDGISKYMAVTPLGKKGYLISRLGISTFISFVVTVAALLTVSLSDLSLKNIFIISILSAMMGFIEALLVVTVSSNKVEGMAVSKLSGLFLIGLPIPFFVTGGFQYIMFFLPSFWLTKYALEQNLLYLLLCIVTSIAWMLILMKKFIRKII